MSLFVAFALLVLPSASLFVHSTPLSLQSAMSQYQKALGPVKHPINHLNINLKIEVSPLENCSPVHSDVVMLFILSLVSREKLATFSLLKAM